MRKLMVAALLSVCASGSAFATPVVWEGAFTITSATAACAAANIAVSDFGVSIFRPRLAGSATNAGDAGISFVFSRSATGVQSKSAAIPIAASSTYSAEEVSGHAGNVGPFAGVLSIASRSPAAISAATPFVLLVGSVTNFEDTPGCTAGFKASYILRN